MQTSPTLTPTETPVEAAISTGRRPTRRDFLFLFLALLLILAYAAPRWNDWNQNSRLSLVRSLVDKGKIQIDDYYASNGDYAFFNGHYYSDKPPGPALAGLLPYAGLKLALANPLADWLLNRLANSSSFNRTFTEGSIQGVAETTSRDRLMGAFARIWLSIVIVALPVSLMACCFWAWTCQLTGRYWSSLVLTLGLVLGTTMFPYSSLFYSNALTAALLFISFYLLDQGRPKPGKGGRYWLVGFLLGMSVISQYETVLIAGPLVLFSLANTFNWPERMRRLVWLGLGGLPPGIALVIYDLVSFNNPLPVGYEYSTLWLDRHSQGFMSLTYPHPEALWGLSFSPYRGIFLLSPFLLLALPGFYFAFRRGGLRLAAALCLWASLAFFLFNASTVMWSGGFTFGPRYMVSALPFLAFGVGLLLREAELRKWPGRGWWFGLPVAVSILVVLPASLVGRNWPGDDIQNPLVNYLWPKVFSGDLALNPGMALGLKGGWSYLPLALSIGLIYLALYYFPGLFSKLSRPNPARKTDLSAS